MSMNESQKRQKAEAMANAEMHSRNSTVDGSEGRNYVEARPWAWGGEQHTEREHAKLAQQDYENEKGSKS